MNEPLAGDGTWGGTGRGFGSLEPWLESAEPTTLPRVLVADDDAAIRRWLRHDITARGYDCRTVTNGAQALALAQAWMPHVIVLDLEMPEMSGCEFLLRRLSLPKLRPLPVVVISGSVLAAPVSFGLGADAVVPKPFRSADLMASIESLLATRAGNTLPMETA